ncbi:hypothetical protein HK405_005120 [Cladochytrium tenue]|nr:hypothetical protein HK405_005120 [Cladochytrium tenue]
MDSTICAVVPHLCQERITLGSSSHWYLRRALVLLPDVTESPSLERVQAVLIMRAIETNVSFHAGRSSVVNYLNQSNVGHPCSDEVWSLADRVDGLTRQTHRDPHFAFRLQIRALMQQLAEHHSNATKKKTRRLVPSGQRIRDALARFSALIPAHLRIVLDHTWVFRAAHLGPRADWLISVELFVKSHHCRHLAAHRHHVAPLLLRFARAHPAAAKRDLSRLLLLRAGADSTAARFWDAVDGAGAIATFVLLARRANAVLAAPVRVVAHYAYVATTLLAAAAALLRIAPHLVAISAASGALSRDSTPHLLLLRSRLTSVENGGSGDEFAAVHLEALAAEVRAFLSDFRADWPVAEWMAHSLDLADTPSHRLVTEAASALGLAISFHNPPDPAAAAVPEPAPCSSSSGGGSGPGLSFLLDTPRSSMAIAPASLAGGAMRGTYLCLVVLRSLVVGVVTDVRKVPSASAAAAAAADSELDSDSDVVADMDVTSAVGDACGDAAASVAASVAAAATVDDDDDDDDAAAAALDVDAARLHLPLRGFPPLPESDLHTGNQRIDF